jgi:hypothetical protein
MLRRLFSAGEVPSRNAEVIRWWELRRIPYNLVVGAVGLASIIVFELIASSMIPPGEDAEEPLALLLGVIVYAVACNVGYTLGWIGEIYFFGHSREAGLIFRNRAFPVGLFLSCVIPTLPAGLWIILWAVGWRPR